MCPFYIEFLLKNGLIKPICAILLCLLLVSFNNSAQIIDTLPEIRVTAQQTGNYVVNNDTIAIESNSTFASIHNLLPNIPFKQQYNGGLTTLTFRGTTAEQQSILWGNININSPFLGLYDLSNLPVMGNHSYIFSTNESNNHLAANTIGLTLQMQNQPNFNNNFTSIEYAVGSYENIGAKLNTSFTDGASNFQLSVLYNKAENNYPYPEENTIKLLQNAAYEYWDIITNYNQKVHNKTVINTSFWLQNRFRNIPFSIPNSYQIDNNLRAKTTINHQINSSLKIAPTLSYFDEYFNYNNDTSNVKRLIFNIVSEKKLSKLSILHFIQLENNFASTKNYLSNTKQNTLTNTFNLSYNHKKNYSSTLIFTYYLRNWEQSYVNINLQFNKKVKNNLHLKLVSAYLNRLPTLNELNWNPGGNPNLKSENSFSNEFLINYSHKNKFLTLKLSGNLLSRNIKNLVQWIRTEQFYWKAENVKKSLTFGSEQKLKAVFTTKNLKQTLTVQSSLYRAINQENNYILPYNPAFKTNANYTVNFKNFNFSIGHIFTSKQFTNNDNSAHIDAYNLVNLSISKVLTIDNQIIEIIFNINNISNEAYQNYNNHYAMGRNYLLTLKFTFQ